MPFRSDLIRLMDDRLNRQNLGKQLRMVTKGFPESLACMGIGTVTLKAGTGGAAANPFFKSTWTKQASSMSDLRNNDAICLERASSLFRCLGSVRSLKSSLSNQVMFSFNGNSQRHRSLFFGSVSDDTECHDKKNHPLPHSSVCPNPAIQKLVWAGLRLRRLCLHRPSVVDSLAHGEKGRKRVRFWVSGRRGLDVICGGKPFCRHLDLACHPWSPGPCSSVCLPNLTSPFIYEVSVHECWAREHMRPHPSPLKLNLMPSFTTNITVYASSLTV